MKKLNKKALSLAVALTVLLCAGCGSDKKGELRTYVKNDNHCTLESAEKRAAFILACINNANPKSDEEPEDWIRQCQYMAEQTLCPVKPIEITEKCGSSTFGGCDWWREQDRKPVGT